MKDLEHNLFAVIFFALWIVVIYHLLAQPGSVVAVTKGVVNSGNSFFGTLFQGKAEYAA